MLPRKPRKLNFPYFQLPTDLIRAQHTGPTCFSFSFEGLDIQSGFPARLEDNIHRSWPGSNPGPMLCRDPSWRMVGWDWESFVHFAYHEQGPPSSNRWCPFLRVVFASVKSLTWYLFAKEFNLRRCTAFLLLSWLGWAVKFFLRYMTVYTQLTLRGHIRVKQNALLPQVTFWFTVLCV